MAKIGHVEFTIGSQYPTKFPLYYTQAHLFEVRGMPKEFFDLTGCSNAGYQTEQNLKNAIWKALPIYHERLKKQRLVIGYACYATPELTMNKVSQGSYQGSLEGISRKLKKFEAFTVPPCTIGIKYFICMEIFNGKKNEYFRVDKNHKVSSSSDMGWKAVDGMTFIDYTEEAFEFFENITKAMQKMAVQMSTFFDLDAEEAALLIETQGVKLLG